MSFFPFFVTLWLKRYKMGEKLIYLLPSLASLICPLAVLFRWSKTSLPQRLMGFNQLLLALSFFMYLSYFMFPAGKGISMNWMFDVIVVFDPVLFILFMKIMTDESQLKPMVVLLLFLPSMIYVFLVSLLFLAASPEELEWVSAVMIYGVEPVTEATRLSWLVAYVGFDGIKVIILLSLVGIIIWSAFKIRGYYRRYDDYFSSEERELHLGMHVIVLFVILLALGIPFVGRYSRHELEGQLSLKLLCCYLALLQAAVSFVVLSSKYTVRDLMKDLREKDIFVNDQTETKSAIPYDKMVKIDSVLLELMEDRKLFLDKDISLVTLAEKMGTNRTYLSKTIHQFHASSFSDFVNEFRIEYALKLLKQDKSRSEDLAALSWECGFISLSSFYRHFQRVVGMNWKEWKKNCLL